VSESSFSLALLAYRLSSASLESPLDERLRRRGVGGGKARTDRTDLVV
jgi:hypothetical protein